jgi:multidrug efflux pump subunit AcrA (membrane-fusion protein)
MAAAWRDRDKSEAVRVITFHRTATGGPQASLLVATIDATGTLATVATVEVGTQVSGTIKSLDADFNSRVRAGQVVARLEPPLFETQAAQARVARIERSRPWHTNR